MKKPSEIFEEHINSLIDYVSEIKDKIKELSDALEKCESYSEQVRLGSLISVYNDIFNDLCSIIKDTMQSAMESKINGNNISDTPRIDE